MCMLCKESIEIILIPASTTSHRGGGRCIWCVPPLTSRRVIVVIVEWVATGDFPRVSARVPRHIKAHIAPNHAPSLSTRPTQVGPILGKERIKIIVHAIPQCNRVP